MASPLSATPMMLQWHECKKKAQDALLLFRLGDFYEAFYEDGILLAKELDLTLTKRQDIPMSGIPFHACENYLDRLIAKGYRVAIAEQVESAKYAKGLVKREIVRFLTPGTVISSNLLSDKANNFLSALVQINQLFGFTLLDLSTGDFRAMEFVETKSLYDELSRCMPSEMLISEKCYQTLSPFLQEFKEQGRCIFKIKENWHFDLQTASAALMRHFGVHSLDGFGLKGMAAATSAAGALVNYVQEDLCCSLAHIKVLLKEQLSDYMAIDRTTQRHLELIEMHGDAQKKITLFHQIDRTATPMGARLLRHWLLHPLLSPEEINQRQDAIEVLSDCTELSSLLEEIRDLERLIARISTGYATPRDLIALKFSLKPIPKLAALLKPISSLLIQKNSAKLVDLSRVTEKIESALVEDPPLRLTDGGIFRKGYREELDALHRIQSDGHLWLVNYQKKLREETGIKTLKVSYTKAFGYYIEVSRGQIDKMPPSFQRRQTLTNAERYLSPELKEYEYKALSADEKILSLEQELFHALRQEIAEHTETIHSIARAVAEIDCLYALARLAREKNYVRPTITSEDVLIIEEGRHPIVEETLASHSFIPNDTYIGDSDNRLLLITGPNMGGKSTYIRQVALIAILAQMGSFVPAKSARIGIVDKLFSRIGASDDLSRGQSTFMVEMAETANILHNATERSLIILDEIGRGTSTYDGISIAWAVAEYLLTEKTKKAKTLFATHYWELTELAKQFAQVVNLHVSVHETKQGIVFMHKIAPGVADKSYGIQVAKLAGLPHCVVLRAQELLQKWEKQNIALKTEKKKSDQLLLF